MCLLISILLPRSVEADRVRPVFERSGCNLELWRDDEYPHHADERTYRPHGGYCDCGTVLGSASRGGDRDSFAQERSTVQKLEARRKKGWSEARLQRWLEQRADDAQRKLRSKTAPGNGTESWLALLTEVLEADLSPWVGLFVAWYGDRDPKLLAPRQDLPFADLTVRRLLTMQYGVPYRFHAVTA